MDEWCTHGKQAFVEILRSGLGDQSRYVVKNGVCGRDAPVPIQRTGCQNGTKSLGTNGFGHGLRMCPVVCD